MRISDWSSDVCSADLPDGIDQCPGTPPGVAVDAKGCPTTLGSGRFKIMGTGADLRFEDVHFAFDKSDLTDYSKQMLDDAATVVKSEEHTSELQSLMRISYAVFCLKKKKKKYTQTKYEE